ncbi:hypothetical protein C8R45DRAFT_1109110 [Mycena sanguinolenta]|nr:hypothetical protein C8R45DRAFT_1109110 [Mycena sanguinolenta]
MRQDEDKGTAAVPRLPHQRVGLAQRCIYLTAVFSDERTTGCSQEEERDAQRYNTKALLLASAADEHKREALTRTRSRARHTAHTLSTHPALDSAIGEHIPGLRTRTSHRAESAEDAGIDWGVAGIADDDGLGGGTRAVPQQRRERSSYTQLQCSSLPVPPCPCGARRLLSETARALAWSSERGEEWPIRAGHIGTSALQPRASSLDTHSFLRGAFSTPAASHPMHTHPTNAPSPLPAPALSMLVLYRPSSRYVDLGTSVLDLILPATPRKSPNVRRERDAVPSVAD